MTSTLLIPHVSEIHSIANSGIAHDFELVFTALCHYIVSRARQAARWKKTTFTIFDMCNEIDVPNRQTNIQYKTFFTGFWDPATRTHSTERFQEAGITTMMLERIQKAFRPRGFIIDDVSDPSRSLHQVLTVTMQE